MKNLYWDTKKLDRRANEEFKMESLLLMENAARGMLEFLESRFLKQNPAFKILLVCGSGDNGADCLALARMLYGKYNVQVYLPLGAKSALCRIQKEILRNICSKTDSKWIYSDLVSFGDWEYDAWWDSLVLLKGYDIIIDGLFGTGFKGDFSCETAELIAALNSQDCIRIACDVPSGISRESTIDKNSGVFVFKADFTLTMGAHKIPLYEDKVKDYVGSIHLINLGVSEKIFAPDSLTKLLERSDFKVPERENKRSNKGDFGHLCVLSGEKQGAAVLSALAGLRSGAGLTTLWSEREIPSLPFELMQSREIPHNATALVLGMGLGRECALPKNLTSTQIPILLDADMFYHEYFKTLLERENIILTPHPKEFVQILTALNLETISVQELQDNRFSHVLKFSVFYPNVTLVLKGANTIIAQGWKVYVNPFGNNALSKGGSGDVLSGIIGGYLAQGYSPLDSAINGVLLHSFCAESYCKDHHNFALSPLDLIEQIGKLESPKP